MAVNTVLLDFSVDHSKISDDTQRGDMVKVIRGELENIFPQLKLAYDMTTEDGYLCIFSENNLILITVRFFSKGLITLNVEYYREEGKPAKLDYDV